MAATSQASGKLLILENFSVFVVDQEGQPERRVTYSKGQVVALASVPDGQSGDDWIAKGLAREG